MSHNRELSGEWLLEPDFQGRPATSSGAQVFFGGAGGSETHRLSARGAASHTLDVPGHNHDAPHGHHAGYDGGHGAASHLAPSPYHPALESNSKQHLRSPTKPGRGGGVRGVGAGSGRLGTKKVWRHRLKLWLRVAAVVLLIYLFGRTVYQLKFFAKAALLRYWYHPLEIHRPMKCGLATPPHNPLLANLGGAGGGDAGTRSAAGGWSSFASFESGLEEGGSGGVSSGGGSVVPPGVRGLGWTEDTSGGVDIEEADMASSSRAAATEGRRLFSYGGSSHGAGSSESSSHLGRAGHGWRGAGGGRGAGGTGGAGSKGSRAKQHVHARTSRAGDIIPVPVGGGQEGAEAGVGFVHKPLPLPQPLPDPLKPGAAAAASKHPGLGAGGEPGGEAGKGSIGGKQKFAILTLCDANAGYICTASVANKRRYAALRGYDLIVSTEVADPSRPAAWSKILEVRKHLPNYDWLLFIDVDTLVMNPDVRLEDIADDSVDQVIAADHNGVNSGVWLVRNSPWMMWFLDELWAQEHLVKGAYLFHYEQRAFHHLFQTEPWTKQASVRGSAPYGGAATVRAHSKIVNQCVFNSLLPWYVSGDFVVHLAGLKGVWECVIFWHYFDKSQERPGMRVTDEQWAREVGVDGGMRRGGTASTLWRCLKFKTLF